MTVTWWWWKQRTPRDLWGTEFEERRGLELENLIEYFRFWYELPLIQKPERHDFVWNLRIPGGCFILNILMLHTIHNYHPNLSYFLLHVSLFNKPVSTFVFNRKMCVLVLILVLFWIIKKEILSNSKIKLLSKIIPDII